LVEKGFVMLEMAKNSIALFFQGKLFADPGKVYRQLAIGIGVTVVLLVGLAKIGLPIWAAAPIAASIGGLIQPYLFKDLRYR
jgi:hypothetical protein